MIKGVSSLELTGAGDVVICSNGAIDGAARVEKRGSKLIIRSEVPPVANSETFFLDSRCRIQRVKMTGSVYFASLPNKFVANDFTVSSSGSGDIILPVKHFRSLSVYATGSGDVIGEKTAANKVKIVSHGSGDISGIHVHDTGTATRSGSGDVWLSATNPKKIAGSGDLKIKRK